MVLLLEAAVSEGSGPLQDPVPSLEEILLSLKMKVGLEPEVVLE